MKQLVGPVYGRLQAEWLTPLVDRVFGLMLRAGALGVPPKELQGTNTNVVFISPLARAQKLEGVVATERLFANAGAIEQVKPGTTDNLDGDQAVREMAQALGVSRKIVRSVDYVAAYRKQKQQQQQQAQMRETLAPVAQEAGIALAQKAIGAA